LSDPNDKHVLAAAVRGQANAIITANIKDFPEYCLEDYGILCQTPDEFLGQQFDLNHPLALEKLDQQAAVIRQTRVQLIEKLAKSTPNSQKHCEKIRSKIFYSQRAFAALTQFHVSFATHAF